MKRSLFIFPILCVAMLCADASGQNSKYDVWDENYAVQALLGAIKYKDLDVVDDEGSGEPVEVDISTIPQLGGAWMTLPQRERFQYGLECSFLLGFRLGEVNYLSAGGNGLYVSISTTMWMFDLAGGGYASLFLDQNERFRIYAGAGPLMTYVDYQSDREETPDGFPTETYTTNESAFGLGVYARTGFEFRVHQRGMLGLGVRGTWSNVDLSDISGSSELVGTAVFATYTAGF